MSEIFRHFRPRWYDRKTHELKPLKNGGISFLLKPHPVQGDYSYWIYICPLDVPFSSKQAVKSLREAYDRNIVAWGHVSIGADPVVDVLVRSVITEQDAFAGSEVGKQALAIVLKNMDAEHAMVKAEEKMRKAKVFYKETRA
jgi:hypothetical protein